MRYTFLMFTDYPNDLTGSADITGLLVEAPDGRQVTLGVVKGCKVIRDGEKVTLDDLAGGDKLEIVGQPATRIAATSTPQSVPSVKGQTWETETFEKSEESEPTWDKGE